MAGKQSEDYGFNIPLYNDHDVGNGKRCRPNEAGEKQDSATAEDAISWDRQTEEKESV